MIDFKSRDKEYYGQAYKRETKERASNFILVIKNRVDNSGTAQKYQLGCDLIDFYDSKSYSCRYKDEAVKRYGSFIGQNASSKVFFAVCEIEFGLDKTQVSRLMNIVSEFGDDRKGIREEYKAYKWSVLAEILPLNAEQRKQITPDMTIKKVREKKKEWLRRRNKKENDEDVNPVLERFKDFTKIELIDLILSLEAELEEYKQDLTSVEE